MRTTSQQKKIIVLGAGIGGLFSAYLLGKHGFDVEVIEKRKKDSLGYFWKDAVNRHTFERVKLDVPDSIISKKQILNFYSPSGEGFIPQSFRASENFDVDRRGLIEFLLKLAESVCTLRFETPADELILENGNVVGVKIDGKQQFCDLVIDSSGIFSPFRMQLADYNMADPLLSSDYLMAHRGFYKKLSPEPAESKVYLMPEDFSVLWSKDTADTSFSDILITDFATLDKVQIEKALEYLISFNPYLTNECVVEESDAIPVRYPLATISGDGYAIIGNAAFMTKPTSGSGIENSLVAAKILANVVKRADNFSASSLWRYAVRVNAEFGANNYMSYIARSRFQVLDRNDLIWVFDSGILNESLLALVRFDMKFIDNFKMENVINSLHLATSKREFLSQIGDILKQCVRARRLARKMPLIYDKNTVAKWKAEYDKFARGL